MFTIYHHNDFDGIATAAIFAYFLNLHEKIGLDEIDFIKVDYDIKNDWADMNLNQPCAVLDFLYHHNANWWFDHHDSTFTNKTSLSLPYSRCKTKYWNTKFYSCPSLFLSHLYIYYRKYYFELKTKFKDLILWSDIIDGARYNSPSDLFRYDNIFLNISKTLAVDNESSYLKIILLSMYQMDFEILKKNERFNNNFKSVIKKEKEAIKIVRRMITIEDKIAFFDQSDYDIPFLRFLAYHLYPNIQYRIAIFKKEEKFSVSVNYNNWIKEKNLINLGELCRKLGGGGRRDVGGVITDTHEAALFTAGTLKKQISTGNIKNQLKLF